MGSTGRTAATAPAPAGSTQSAAPVGAPVGDQPGVDYQDPLAVTAVYLTVRWTYAFTDPAGYATALTAPQLTTPAFAARSAPDPTSLAQLATAHESSTVAVLSAAPSREAPNTDSTTYVTARFTVTSTYNGAASGTPTDHVWSLRLLAAEGQWRVDGVAVAG